MEGRGDSRDCGRRRARNGVGLSVANACGAGIVPVGSLEMVIDPVAELTQPIG
jgi:hypothetical protein